MKRTKVPIEDVLTTKQMINDLLMVLRKLPQGTRLELPFYLWSREEYFKKSFISFMRMRDGGIGKNYYIAETRAIPEESIHLKRVESFDKREIAKYAWHEVILKNWLEISSKIREELQEDTMSKYKRMYDERKQK